MEILKRLKERRKQSNNPAPAERPPDGPTEALEWLRRYSELYDSLPVGYLTLNCKGEIRQANLTAARLLDVNRGQLIGESFHKYISLKDSDMFLKHLRRVFEEQVKQICEIELEGRGIHVRIESEPIVEPGIGFLCRSSLTDITKYRKVIEELEEHKTFLSSLFDSIGQGVLLISRDFRVISANSGYLNQYKDSLNKVKGKYCYEVSHHIGRPCYLLGEKCPVKMVFESGSSHQVTHTHFDRDGKPVYVEITSYPLKTPSGDIKYAVEVLRDISAIVKQEKELKKRLKELEEFHEIAVERELKMMELKEEIEKLKKQLRGK